MFFMYLYIYWLDGRVEKYRVKRFSDLSHTKSRFYYYELPHEEKGKGHSFLRDDIICFEVSPFPLQNWDEYIKT